MIEERKKRVFICGDSTAASYKAEETLIVGWGQLLDRFLNGTEVVNHAMAGRSTKSFLAEGRLQRVLDEIAPGDLLLIQFAHNDESDKPERHTDPWTSYRDNLIVFISSARKSGAVPVLLTPICIRLWENDVLQQTHGEYLKAMKDVSVCETVPLIDLYQDSFRIVEKMGEVKSRSLYMNLCPGEDPRYPDGLQDNTHTRFAGAEAYARCAADGLFRMGLV